MALLDAGIETQTGVTRSAIDTLPLTEEGEAPRLIGYLPHAMARLVVRHIQDAPNPADYEVAAAELAGHLTDGQLERHRRALYGSPEVTIGGEAVKSIFALHDQRLEGNGIQGAYDALDAYDLRIELEPAPEPSVE